MTERFRNKYRIQTTRLAGYDYKSDGFYLVTICTKNHICYFGEVITDNGIKKMVLSKEGEIVLKCWLDLPRHYFNLILDEFVIMPNHFHGIIFIKNIPEMKKVHGLSEFVRAFKSFSSRGINKIRISKDEIWQSRFYDNIIRTDNDLGRVRDYIKNNPDSW